MEDQQLESRAEQRRAAGACLGPETRYIALELPKASALNLSS